MSDWESELSNTFYWSGDEPGPATVTDEAKARGFESVDELINKLNDAPSGLSGYARWKWFRGWCDAFSGNPDS